MQWDPHIHMKLQPMLKTKKKKKKNQTRKAIFKLFSPWVEKNFKALFCAWYNKENGEKRGRKSEKGQKELGFKNYNL